MFNKLKNHPFAVEAFFESSLVLTYAVPKEQLQTMVPDCLQLDTFDDKWAFVAVALVQTKNLRPKGFPAFMGNDFFLLGYRIFVRYTNKSGKRLRGLFILKSETDKTKMVFFGNIFTHYKYTSTDITYTHSDTTLAFSSKKSDFKVCVDARSEEVALPMDSPFADWKEARRFAGPLPFTFTVDTKNKQILIIEGVRESWIPQSVEVIHHEFRFLDALGIKNPVLANAFIVKNIPYHWKKGIIETWK